ncbi:hypothetical protein N0U24_18300 [Peribacillus frigoritolerans]|uniref:hypothetical protein n=1 Tax=Peribacillus frigoritolerans TaxID=450367 RepID=UPI0021AA527B|nr:hypothetical protein [Peribacillus frigoritolerans]MCT4479068.1 hypothetical protein [Peribacillus frigoritolerans]
MEKFNLIKQNHNVVPNYKVNDKEVSFEIYISPKQEVCIIGKLDNNYKCWCSITPISDYENNSAIFQYVSNLQTKTISNDYKALGDRYKEVKNWHRMQISKRPYQDQYLYYSPVNSSFFTEGKFFGREIYTFYKQERAKCDYRLIDDAYITILKRYKSILNKENQEYSYYHEMNPLIKIIKDESYIKLCPISEIRQLYLECLEKCDDLYNRYMTEVR